MDTRSDYQKSIDALLPAAVNHAVKLHPRPEDASTKDREKWGAAWNATYFKEVDRLAHIAGVRYSPRHTDLEFLPPCRTCGHRKEN